MSNDSKRDRGRRLFLEQCDAQLDRVRQWLAEEASADRNKDEIHRSFHSWKGSAPMFGFDQIGRIAAELEERWEANARRDGMIEPLEKLSDAIAAGWALQALPREEEESDARSMVSGRVLVVDDDEQLRGLLVERLTGDGFEAQGAATVSEAKEYLMNSHYDVISLDLMMQPEPGYALFEFLKDNPSLRWVPLIVLSGNSGLDDKLRCFRMGADDYVTKPFVYEEYSARVRRMLERRSELQVLAFRDPLTGAFNRRYFDQQLKQEVERSQRYDTRISIGFIDIDKFKNINDTYGHQTGDKVLQGLAHLLGNQIRSTDLLARYGGEEFVVLFPNTSKEEAAEVLRKLLELARSQPIAFAEKLPVSITFSAGVAELIPNVTIERWLELADQSMYRAKQNGRNQVLAADDTQAAFAPEPKVSKRKVLVADDDAILRSILVSRLSELSLEVYEAEDGEDAYRLLKEQPFDLCILDGVMPKKDGFSLLKQVKDEMAVSPTKYLVLSGRKREDDIVRGLKLGADEYMVKPFSLVELEIRAKRLLGLE